MPVWDARSCHSIDIAAPIEHVYQSLLSVDIGRNLVVRVLMGIRAVPALFLAPHETWTRWRRSRHAAHQGPTGSLLAGAFVLLDLSPPTEVTLGLTGRFW